MAYIGSLDQGTSSTRFIVFDESGKIVGQHQLERTQFLPTAGWVEHDAAEIWNRTQMLLPELSKPHESPALTSPP